MAEERTLYIKNLDDKVSEDILEEVFTQIGPVESVSIVTAEIRYAFVQFKDEESVPFGIKMMDGLRLYNTAIAVRPRDNTEQDRKYKEQLKQNQQMNESPLHMLPPQQHQHVAQFQTPPFINNSFIPLYQPPYFPSIHQENIPPAYFNRQQHPIQRQRPSAVWLPSPSYFNNS